MVVNDIGKWRIKKSSHSKSPAQTKPKPKILRKPPKDNVIMDYDYGSESVPLTQEAMLSDNIFAILKNILKSEKDMEIPKKIGNSIFKVIVEKKKKRKVWVLNFSRDPPEVYTAKKLRSITADVVVSIDDQALIKVIAGILDPLTALLSGEVVLIKGEGLEAERYAKVFQAIVQKANSKILGFYALEQDQQQNNLSAA